MYNIIVYCIVTISTCEAKLRRADCTYNGSIRSVMAKLLVLLQCSLKSITSIEKVVESQQDVITQQEEFIKKFDLDGYTDYKVKQEIEEVESSYKE